MIITCKQTLLLILQVRVWDDTEEEPIQEFKLSNTVLGVSYHAPFLVAASTTIQVTNSTNYDWKRTIADDSTEDESLEDPPLHMATYCPDGHLITATAESNIIKIWPPTSANSVGGAPKNTIKVQEKTKDVGTIKRICVSPVDELPWLGAVIQPGPLLSPKNTKKVFIYNWKEDKIYHILDTGKGGLEFNVEMSFAYDGEYMIIGYNNKLTKWHTQSGEMEMDFDMLKKDDIITAIACSPNSTHAAVGLTNGDIKIIDYETAQLTFTLRNNNIHTPAVSSLSYSADGNNLASGHTGGLVQIWKKVLHK
jgi:WD40 repeat protein